MTTKKTTNNNRKLRMLQSAVRGRQFRAVQEYALFATRSTMIRQCGKTTMVNAFYDALARRTSDPFWNHVDVKTTGRKISACIRPRREIQGFPPEFRISMMNPFEPKLRPKADSLKLALDLKTKINEETHTVATFSSDVAGMYVK